jgi:hypothetical protein
MEAIALALECAAHVVAIYSDTGDLTPLAFGNLQAALSMLDAREDRLG